MTTNTPAGTKCTWKNCNRPASHPQIESTGEQWANLCDEHTAELDASVDSLDPGDMLRTWILAAGGVDAMMRAITKESPA